MVVDDTPFLRSVASYLLQERGHYVVEADCGPRALQILDVENFDVVLMDVEMPGSIDGREAGRAMRAKPSNADLMIVMHTSKPRAHVDSVFSDYDDFLEKPCPADVFVPRLERLVSYRQVNLAVVGSFDVGRGSIAEWARTAEARQAVLDGHKAKLQEIIVEANDLYERCKRAMGQ